jgi:DNA-binding CsgD family transcriptional regulator
LNRRAQEILDEGDGFEPTRIREFMKPQMKRARGILSVARKSCRRPYQVMVSPMRSRRDSSWLCERAAWGVFVSDPDLEVEKPEKALAELFSLTPAEARLAAELMKGRNLEQIADSFRLSRNTIRTQLRAVFQKTNTSRQGELIRVLWTSPASLRAR